MSGMAKMAQPLDYTGAKRREWGNGMIVNE